MDHVSIILQQVNQEKSIKYRREKSCLRSSPCLVLILEETDPRVVGENLFKKALCDEEWLCSSLFFYKNCSHQPWFYGI